MDLYISFTTKLVLPIIKIIKSCLFLNFQPMRINLKKRITINTPELINENNLFFLYTPLFAYRKYRHNPQHNKFSSPIFFFRINTIVHIRKHSYFYSDKIHYSRVSLNYLLIMTHRSHVVYNFHFFALQTAIIK